MKRKMTSEGLRIISGHIRDYDVFIANDVVTVINEKVIVTKQRVVGISRFVERAKDFRLGWAMLPDDEVIYLYDKGEENYGYAVNLHYPSCSEWGCAPFS